MHKQCFLHVCNSQDYIGYPINLFKLTLLLLLLAINQECVDFIRRFSVFAIGEHL